MTTPEPVRVMVFSKKNGGAAAGFGELVPLASGLASGGRWVASVPVPNSPVGPVRSKIDAVVDVAGLAMPHVPSQPVATSGAWPRWSKRPKRNQLPMLAAPGALSCRFPVRVILSPVLARVIGLNWVCRVLVLKALVPSSGTSKGLDELPPVTFPAMLEAQPVSPVAGRASWRMSRVPVAEPCWLASVMVATTA